MSVADLPLILWDEVPEGPVWFRRKDCPHAHYINGTKALGRLFAPGEFPNIDPAPFQFIRAEQQPGEWAAELAVTDKLLAERQRVLDAIPECPAHGPCVPHALEWIEQQKRLRDGLAALEQEMREHHASGQPAFDFQLREWADRLAALREGR